MRQSELFELLTQLRKRVAAEEQAMVDRAFAALQRHELQTEKKLATRLIEALHADLRSCPLSNPVPKTKNELEKAAEQAIANLDAEMTAKLFE